MSSCERSAWIRLASILLVFVPYFRYALELLQRDGPVGRATCVAFIVAALAHGLLNGLGQLALALVFGRTRRDERDAAIDAVSLRIACFTLITLVLLALSTIAFLDAITRPSPAGTILLPTFSTTSQFVLLAIVAAEALRHATPLFCDRREAMA